jgi:hypothetical protein
MCCLRDEFGTIVVKRSFVVELANEWHQLVRRLYADTI